ncbi:MAG: DNA polymerase III subunit chi [Methylophilus sp.]
MTRVRFYTDVPDRASLILHLVEQAVARQRQVTIYLESPEAAEQLSHSLWQQSVFIPNVLADAPQASLTPVLLAWLPEHIRQDDMLFNCQTELPKFFSRFRHLFELIGSAEDDKTAGRQRYAFYRDRGYEIQHMKMQTQ